MHTITLQLTDEQVNDLYSQIDKLTGPNTRQQPRVTRENCATAKTVRAIEQYFDGKKIGFDFKTRDIYIFFSLQQFEATDQVIGNALTALLRTGQIKRTAAKSCFQKIADSKRQASLNIATTTAKAA